jgi:hypothetical protein
MFFRNLKKNDDQHLGAILPEDHDASKKKEVVQPGDHDASKKKLSNLLIVRF